jgi:general stress protein 26
MCGTNHELELDPSVSLFFQGSKHSDFLHLHGRATISQDRSKIREV